MWGNHTLNFKYCDTMYILQIKNTWVFLRIKKIFKNRLTLSQLHFCGQKPHFVYKISAVSSLFCYLFGAKPKLNWQTDFITKRKTTLVRAFRKNSIVKNMLAADVTNKNNIIKSFFTLFIRHLCTLNYNINNTYKNNVYIGRNVILIKSSVEIF